MKSLQKTAKKFIKELKGVITFDTVIDYLQKSGYTIMYYSSPECHALLDKYNLIEFHKTVNAFTYICDCSKFIFVNDKAALQDMLCSILHETAHIRLGHLLSNPYSTDDRKNEMEAEAFVYTVLNYKMSYLPHIIVILIVLASFTVIYFCYSYAKHTIPVTTPIAVTEEIVYITPTGSKYHHNSCIYVKNKNCTAVTKTQAKKNFQPCSVCNP